MSAIANISRIEKGERLTVSKSENYFLWQNWLNTWEQGKGGLNDTPRGFAHPTAWASIGVGV